MRPPPRGWLRPAVVMAALTALVPSVAYIELGRTLSGGFVGLPKHFAEPIGACSALFLSLLILRHYNKKEELGLDLKELFALKPYGRTGLVFAAAALAGRPCWPASWTAFYTPWFSRRPAHWPCLRCCTACTTPPSASSGCWDCSTESPGREWNSRPMAGCPLLRDP